MSEATNTNKPELRSAEVQEIIGHVPRWIVRRGSSMITFLILALLTGSWFFKYPDVVRSKITLTTTNPPANVVAKASGRIRELFVQDTQQVKEGQKLALIENPANFSDILEVKKKLSGFQKFLQDFDTLLFEPFDNDYALGTVQTAFSDFLKDYRTYQTFVRINYHTRKLISLHKELQKYRIYYNRLYRQRNLTEQELHLVEKQAQRDSVLFSKKVIPQAAMDRSKGNLLAKKREFEQARVNLSTADIQISVLEQEILNIQTGYANQKKNLEHQLIKSTNNLTAEIRLWEQTYLLRAPVNGRVSFTQYWSKDQNVNIGDKVLTIVPSYPGNIIGKMKLKIHRSGKVKPGQKVNIKLDNYPYMEFGMLKGIVTNISITPSDQFYMVEVDLPESLTTNYNIPLEFDQEMTGTAEIITEDRRLLTRLLEPFRYIFERNFRSIRS